MYIKYWRQGEINLLDYSQAQLTLKAQLLNQYKHNLRLLNFTVPKNRAPLKSA